MSFEPSADRRPWARPAGADGRSRDLTIGRLCRGARAFVKRGAVSQSRRIIIAGKLRREN